MEFRNLLRKAGLTERHLDIVGELFESGSGYEYYDLQKRRGGMRRIFVADVEISSVLKLLLRALEASGIYDPPDCVHGYVKGRGIRSNATQHLDCDVVLSLDLMEFFPSITRARIQESLVQLGLDDSGARAIARVATIDGILAPGLSPSPWLSNVVFRSSDVDLVGLAASMGVTYTRFADDLTFSGSFSDEVLIAIRGVLEARGWEVNESKTRFMRRGGPQYVTGLYVGRRDQPHVPRRIKRRLRQRLHYMAKYGFADVHRRDRGEAMFHNQAAGWVRHIGNIEPRVAKRLELVVNEVDFGDEFLYWTDPDDWSAILKEIGLQQDRRGH